MVKKTSWHREERFFHFDRSNLRIFGPPGLTGPHCAKARFSSFSFFKEFLDRTSKKTSTSGGRKKRDPEKNPSCPRLGFWASKIEVVGCYKNSKELLHVLWCSLLARDWTSLFNLFVTNTGRYEPRDELRRIRGVEAKQVNFQTSWGALATLAGKLHKSSGEVPGNSMVPKAGTGHLPCHRHVWVVHLLICFVLCNMFVCHDCKHLFLYMNEE